ncbi:MAG: YicC/YloC family endoribonuclease [Pikeienuella sp.]
MTGFAAVETDAAGRRWRWEAKSVNGRGLDLRFRLAEGAEALEPELRALAAKAFSRGNVSIWLRADDGGEAPRASLDETALRAAIDAALTGEAMAEQAGLHLAPASIAEFLRLRGVMEPSAGGAPDGAALAALRQGFAALLDGLAAARKEEGARTRDVVAGFIDRIETLTLEAAGAFEASREGAAGRLRERLAALLEAGAETPPERLAQELALIAVKADIREELDRLQAHVAAARDLLAARGPVGRKLDFLTQEFNREANTLCSKASSAALTAIGLELKVVIDQLREQAQNVE